MTVDDSAPGVIDIIAAGYEGRTKVLTVARHGIEHKLYVRLLSDLSTNYDGSKYDSGFLEGADVVRIFGDSYTATNWIQLNALIMFLLRAVFDDDVPVPILGVDAGDVVKRCNTPEDFETYFSYLKLA